MSDLLWKRMYVYNSEHKRVVSAIGPEGQWARALEQLYAEEVAQLCLWMKSNISGIRDLCEVISKRQKPLHIQILAFQYTSYWETWKVKKCCNHPHSPLFFLFILQDLFQTSEKRVSQQQCVSAHWLSLSTWVHRSFHWQLCIQKAEEWQQSVFQPLLEVQKYRKTSNIVKYFLQFKNNCFLFECILFYLI